MSANVFGVAGGDYFQLMCAATAPSLDFVISQPFTASDKLIRRGISVSGVGRSRLAIRQVKRLE
jgi:hypothetical protein